MDVPHTPVGPEAAARTEAMDALVGELRRRLAAAAEGPLSFRNLMRPGGFVKVSAS